MPKPRMLMRTADLTTRSVAGFIDLLLITGLVRLPDITGFLSAIGYILLRDGLFARQSVGKKLIGLRLAFADEQEGSPSFRESIIRNATFAAAYLLWQIPVAGWALGPLVLAAEYIATLGDDRRMRIGDLLAGTVIVADARIPAGRNVPSTPQEGPAGNPQENRPQPPAFP